MIPLDQLVKDYAVMPRPEFDRKHAYHAFVWTTAPAAGATAEEEPDPHGPTISIKTRTPPRGYVANKETGTQIIPIVRRPASLMSVITIGRLHTDASLHTNDVVFADDRVSKFHASLGLIGSEMQLTDKGSTNGTYVNNTRLEPNRPYRLADKDLVHIGGPRSQIELVYHNPAGLRKYLEGFVTKEARKPSA